VELVLALEYLHKLGVVYRDLKPENIMIQQMGHIMLVDFDLSKKLNPKSPNSLSCNSSPGSKSPDMNTRKTRWLTKLYFHCNSGTPKYDTVNQLGFNSPFKRSESDSVEKSNSFVGTEDYVAPEVISGHGHNLSVDWWSYGVVLYEMFYGTTPFNSANRKETFHKILNSELEQKGETTPLKDLIAKLLEKDPDRRIQVDEIKDHDFFKGVKWDTVLEIARPPYIPQNEVVDKAGFSRKDVESFVHGIFFPKNKNDNGEKEKNKEEVKKEDGKEKENGNDDSSNNKNVWVEKLSQQTKDENFLIF
jgi:serine/threonine protein kinase